MEVMQSSATTSTSTTIYGKRKTFLTPKMLNALLTTTTTLVVAIYLLISLGGLVRNAGAGLSCPDWPLCHGSLVPAQKLLGTETNPAGTPVQIFLEWFHRLIAGSISIGVLVVSAVVFSNSILRKTLGKFAVLALSLLASQVVLGGLTVLGLLSPKWVVSHLIVGMSFFLTMLWMRLELKRTLDSGVFVVSAIKQPDVLKNNTRKVALDRVSLVVFGLVFVQAFLGGLVSSNYAGLACLDFPLCNGQWIPAFEGLVKFQFLHRLGAVFATIGMIVFFIHTSQKKSLDQYTWMRYGSLALLGLQISLGAGMIFFQLPLLMSVAHLAVASAILASILMLIHAQKTRALEALEEESNRVFS